MTEWPRGKSEGQSLEFKGRGALKQMRSIAREVVGMLNASGGEIWIGVAEEAGMAVRVEPIEDAEKRKQALWNHLVDTLDPIPRADEVSLESFDTLDGSVIRIEVAKVSERKPYAYRDDGPRFVQRIGARVRPIATQDLRDLFAPRTAAGRAADSFLGPLLGERERLVGEGASRYWVRLQPSRGLGLNYGHSFVIRCLSNASVTGNRESGWTFRNPIDPPEIRRDHLRQGQDEGTLIRIHGDGWIDFRAPLLWLWHGEIGDKTPLIYPFALLERTASLFRLAKTLYSNPEIRPEGLGIDFKVAADLALVGARGWKLRPYSPKALGYQLKHEERELEEDSLLLERPLIFEGQEVIDQPDQCAYRLLIPVYESFGYSEDKIPSEFDRQSGRLVLPS